MKRGPVTGRPWGSVLAEIASERLSGELEISVEGKLHAIAFESGLVANAVSPGAADSIARIALTSHYVTSTHVPEIVKRIAAAPRRDELDVLAEVAHLSGEQRETLRRKAVIQRAARTFAIEHANYAFTDGDVPIRGEPLDVRAVIYLGARIHLAETRLANELRGLGARFVLLVERDVERFGFTDAERPILDALRQGASVAELEATYRDVDPRMISAVVYALATTGALAATVVARTMTPQPAVSRTMTPPAVSRTMTPPVVSRTMTPPVISRTMTPPAVSRTTTPPPGRPQTSPPFVSRTMTPPAVSRTMTPPPGRAPTSNPVVSRTPTGGPAISRTATGHPDMPRTPTKDRTPEWIEGRDAFQQGEMAMRREQLGEAAVCFARAVEVQPENADYLAMLAWVKFCGAPDKAAVADESRRVLDRACKLSAEAVTPWLCLGRVERMLGNDKEALKHFAVVLQLQPHNSTAASEVRVLEARLRR